MKRADEERDSGIRAPGALAGAFLAGVGAAVVVRMARRHRRSSRVPPRAVHGVVESAIQRHSLDLSAAHEPPDPDTACPDPDDPRKPDSPTDLTRRSVRYVLRQTAREFSDDQCTDLAAALTYYAVLSLFPALLAVVSLLGVFGAGRADLDTIAATRRANRPGSAVEQLRRPDRAAGRDAVGRLRSGVRLRRRAVVGFGLCRRVRPGDEPDLRGRRGPAVLEAAPADAADHARPRRAGRGAWSPCARAISGPVAGRGRRRARAGRHCA